MNRLLWITIVVFSIQLQAQAQVEVEKGSFPFNQVIEWPRKGTLLLGDDPSGRTQEINFSLLNHNGEVQWNRSVYPKNEPTHIILSGISDYVYFVDDLVPVNKYIRYNQVNESGSIVPAKFDLLKVIREYGYRTPDALELKDIINTQKSIVFYFQLPVKDKGIIENFFVSITHHNNNVYHCQGPSTDMDLRKSGEEGGYIFAGSTADAICFSRYEFKKGTQYASYFSFSPKGKPRIGVTQEPQKVAAIPSALHFVGLNGQYYLEKEKVTKAITTLGRGLFIKGRYYYIANDAKDKCLKIYGTNEKDEFVVLNTCKHSAKEKKKYKNATLTFIPLEEKVIIVSNIADQTFAYEIENNQVRTIDAANLDYERIRTNPSALRVKDKSNKFVHFIGDDPYFINPTTLEQSNKIIFKK